MLSTTKKTEKENPKVFKENLDGVTIEIAQRNHIHQQNMEKKKKRASGLRFCAIIINHDFHELAQINI